MFTISTPSKMKKYDFQSCEEELEDMHTVELYEAVSLEEVHNKFCINTA